jgi:hypothetical protein
MNLRTALTALSLTLGTLTSATAFAQTPSFRVAVHPGYARPAAQPVFVQPAAQPVYVQPTYAQPAAQPVFVQPGYVQPGAQPVYAQPNYGRNFAARRELMRFNSAVQARVAQAEQQLRVGIARGAVNAQAMNAFEAQRAQVQGALAMASQDGVLAPQEQFRVDRMTARLERLDAQFRVVQAPAYRTVTWR